MNTLIPAALYPAKVISGNMQNLEDAISEYNAVLNEIIEDIDFENSYDASLKIQLLNNKSINLDKSIFNAIQPILAVTEQAFANDPNFEQLFTNQLMSLISDNQQGRISFNFELINHFLDTTDIATVNELKNAGEIVLGYNDLLPITISQFTNLTSQYEAPAHNMIYDFNYSKEMEFETLQLVKVYIKNYGAVNSTGLYAKLETDELFSIDTDSIYIGDVASQSLDSISFIITAPSVDTVGSVRIVLLDDAGNPCGRAIAFRATGNLTTTLSGPRNLSKEFVVNISPNPAEGYVNIDIDSPLSREVIVSIAHLNGQLIKEENIGQVLKGRSSYKIDIRGIRTGIYLIQVYSNNFSNTKRLFIQNSN